MENLVELYFSEQLGELAGRVRFSEGVYFASRAEALVEKYYVGSPLPREPWKLPASVSVGPGQTVPINTLYRSVFIDSINFDIPLDFDQSIDEQSKVQRDLQGALHAFFTDRYSVWWEQTETVGFIKKPPSMRTVTSEVSTGRKPGLHLDRWGHLAEQDGYLRTSLRVNVNLGPGDREFLFSIAHSLNIQEHNSRIRPHEQHAGYLEFLTDVPDTPLLSVRLQPGEFYIAPTDCVLHDASTRLSSTSNWTFQLKTSFGKCPNARKVEVRL